jgi:uncharacterized protein (TIGR03435 family)
MGLLLLMPALTTAQGPAFEVASVKPNVSGIGQMVLPLQPGGRVTLSYRTLRQLIQFAYSPIGAQLQDFQIAGGPRWMNVDHFDVVANMGGNPAPGRETADMMRLMFRTLLADRFHVIVHREVRELPVYALVLARSDGRLGAGLRHSTADCSNVPPPTSLPDPNGPPPAPCGLLQGTPGRLGFRGVTIGDFARSGLVGLARVDRTVIDRTGLTGSFDIDVQWSVASAEPTPNAPPNSAPSIFTAIQEQLGLKLEPQRGPVDVLVVDRADKPSPD